MTNQTTAFSPNPSQLDIDQSLKEIAPHGNGLFPVGIHYTAHTAGEKTMIHKHWHREMELIYITKSTMKIIVEEQEIVAKEGEIVFIPSNLLHEARHQQLQACAFFAIVSDPYFIGSPVSDIIQQSYIDPILKNPKQHVFHVTNQVKQLALMQTYLRQMIDAFVLKEPGFELLLKANLLLFFKAAYEEQEQLFHYNQKIKPRSEHTSYQSKKILLYIDENYMNHITLEEVSRELGYSKEHFCRFFKKNFHTSFFTYLNQMRIKKAEYLLSHSQLKVIDIAMETGFEDANYFTTIFKRETGVTPTQYRKNQATN